ncbi:MAG: methyltransferase domain-containing protein [Planctomycetes bacterium]|nr:methyltransferase domain-containing protein [Planctomycetota bacterium]
MSTTLKSALAGPETANPSTEVDIGWQVTVSDDYVQISSPGFTDSDVRPPDWHDRLVEYFSRIPSLVAIGPKQVTAADGNVWSMGDFVIHPKGFHHQGRGEQAECYRFPEEVDVLSAGLVLVERSAYDAVGGLDAQMGCLAAVDLCLKLRLEGGRCLAAPDVVMTVEEADLSPGRSECESFHRQWGFDWSSPDLDDVRSQYAGTGLLWNVRYHGQPLPFEKYDQQPAIHWNNYVNVEPYRKRADLLVKSVIDLTPSGLCVDLGCGDGLYSHLLALSGIEVLGIDPEESAINQALAHVTACKTYPRARPCFAVSTGSQIPVNDASVQTVILLDVIEHLPNPIRVLCEVARVLKPGGHLFASTPASQYAISSDPAYHVTEYSPTEFKHQINSVPGLVVTNMAGIGGMYRDILITACKQA